mgnify:CR=1 FL=1
MCQEGTSFCWLTQIEALHQHIVDVLIISIAVYISIAGRYKLSPLPISTANSCTKILVFDRRFCPLWKFSTNLIEHGEKK